ncbi:MAG: hypothetical protein HQL49_09430 [Gammaproteobacteria bacterium]|nr:hypothetical protein [Gammaproteobacteria bacterium]
MKRRLSRVTALALLCAAPLTLTSCGDEGVSSRHLPTLTVLNAAMKEGDKDDRRMKFVVNVDSSAGAYDLFNLPPISVDYTTGTPIESSPVYEAAGAGSDYTATSGTLTIPSGYLSGNIYVDISGDTDVEADEAFSLTLSNPVNANLVYNYESATGYIYNDDSIFRELITPESADLEIEEGDADRLTTLVVTFSLSRVSRDTDIIVEYITVAGSQTETNEEDLTTVATSSELDPNRDFIQQTGTVIFVAGEVEASFEISIVGDDTYEADEQFSIYIPPLTEAENGVQLAQGRLLYVTILNDDEAPVEAP